MGLYIFNFSSSYSGGGYKRLEEYAKWFNEQRPSLFIIHKNSSSLSKKYPNNRYFIVDQSKLQRLINDCSYLKELSIEKVDLYYSYGIPIYNKYGKVNWFHISNVLPIQQRNVPLSCVDYIKFKLLGKRIKDNYKNADIISAESKFTLSIIKNKYKNTLFLSVNGSDDELDCYNKQNENGKDDIATIMGTYKYKGILDSFKIFKNLQDKNKHLKLVIIGDEKYIPLRIKREKDVNIVGKIDRGEVVNILKKTKIYISMTYIENSYNAASEGIYLADESYISAIGPHKELLENTKYDVIKMPGINREILHTYKKNLMYSNIKSWKTIIHEMITKVESLKL